jgi:hypothetical protein
MTDTTTVIPAQAGNTRERAIIDLIAEVAAAVGFQAGVGAMELAGQIVSVLHANPEHIDRFMYEGVALFHDGTFDAVNGSLTYMAISGKVTAPTSLRKAKGRQQ